MNIYAKAMRLIHVPLSFINFSVRMDQAASTMCVTLMEVSLIFRAILTLNLIIRRTVISLSHVLYLIPTPQSMWLHFQVWWVPSITLDETWDHSCHLNQRKKAPSTWDRHLIQLLNTYSFDLTYAYNCSLTLSLYFYAWIFQTRCLVYIPLIQAWIFTIYGSFCFRRSILSFFGWEMLFFSSSWYKLSFFQQVQLFPILIYW